MQEAPGSARQQWTRNVLSGVVGFVMFVGVAVFAWTMGNPSGPPVAPSAEVRATQAAAGQGADGDDGADKQDMPSVPTADAPVEDSADVAASAEEVTAAPHHLQEAQDALAADGPVTALVLGDSTGDDTRKWVHLWARSLAPERPVSISHWDAGSDPGYYPVVGLSTDGVGSRLMIWNGSEAGGTPATARERLGAFVPEVPDVVLLNFGQASAIQDFPVQMGSLVDGIRERFGDIPVLMVAQNPHDAEADIQVRAAGTQWAEQADVGVLDVAGEFPAFDQDLPAEATSTSAKGQDLWAQIVTDALG